MLIRYRRQVTPKQYESEAVEIEAELDDHTVIMDAFADIKAHVLTQLGIAYQIDEQGVVRELASEAPQVAPTPQFAPPPTQSAPQQAFSPPAQGMQCPQCNGFDFWDNRQENDRRRQEGYRLTSDFKCKNSACGAPNGRPWVKWPEDYSTYRERPVPPWVQ